MLVELIPGINVASGTLMRCKNGARIIFTTRRAPSSNPHKMRMYIRSAESYKRKTPVSKREMQVRSIFAKRQERVRQLMNQFNYLSKKEAWAIAKREITD